SADCRAFRVFPLIQEPRRAFQLELGIGNRWNTHVAIMTRASRRGLRCGSLATPPCWIRSIPQAYFAFRRSERRLGGCMLFTKLLFMQILCVYPASHRRK